jgi:hypothetical protein
VVGGRCIGGFHIRNHMRQVIITGFGEMHFI